MAPATPILGYWELRGLAAPIRYMLHYLGVEFEDKQYGMGTPPNFNKDQWDAVKNKLNLEFPNLPYYIDGDLAITESSAIMNHLARKHGLAGSCEKDYLRLDVAIGVMQDIGRDFAMMCYSPDFEKRKVDYIANLPGKVEKLSKLLGQGSYILGDKIACMDFVLLEILERLTLLVPDCLAKHANLTKFHARMLALPGVAKYRSSPSFQKIKTRFNSPLAHFGHGRDSY